MLVRLPKSLPHPEAQPLHRGAPRPMPHAFSLILGLASILLFWGPLQQLVSLSLNDQRYSHIILVPAIGAGLIFMERRKVFARAAFAIAPGLFLLSGSLVLYWLTRHTAQVPETYTLSMAVLAILLVWASGFALCYGVEALRAARFPLLFLLLLVPIPFEAMDKIVAVLQRGTAEATYTMFHLAGVPMFKDGVRFELPGIGIEVAAECSSIHSAWALFITGLLLAHWFLKSPWTKICLSILTVPTAIFTNAVRIGTLWFLATRVDPAFLFGNLHHRGGALFSLISLPILLGLLCSLRKLESHGSHRRKASEEDACLTAPGRGQTATFS